MNWKEVVLGLQHLLVTEIGGLNIESSNHLYLSY